MLLKLGPVTFPEPQDIIINMMPFIFGDLYTLPEPCRAYASMLALCRLRPGSTAYLTIHESLVPAGYSQRRPGLHTERICPQIAWGGGWGGYQPMRTTENYGGTPKTPKSKLEQPTVPNAPPPLKTLMPPKDFGLYVASSVADTCRFWDTEVDPTGHLGDCEGLRAELTGVPSVNMEANRLYWLGDNVPHESIPVAVDTYRQWIRVVSEHVGIWYSRHSTPNPFGILPGAPIVTGDKFAPAGGGTP